jgi:hypothetical protein
VSPFPPRYYLGEATTAAARFEAGDARTATGGLLPGEDDHTLTGTTTKIAAVGPDAGRDGKKTSVWSRFGPACFHEYLFIFYLFNQIVA